ncbi:hypothetical protein NJC10_10200 [Micrococcus sp. M4NT]|uniref:hypothetical protein n=1 Tax=Micrococcus sp. M4NT TaxID=2957501 RepID=UPI0029B130E5|nr:hypothetical protein [Micrococcus sp. M4NT]MDX2342021.1 hypothetical protein [Micrococcus sp. M4NT]
MSASRTAPSPGGVLSVADTETARAWIADVLAVPEDVGGGSPPSAQKETLLDLAMILAVPNRLSAWGTLQDEDAWAEHSDWITSLWREAGTLVAEVAVP